jgi:hypothetical protein
MNLVPLTRTGGGHGAAQSGEAKGSILLIKPPYFSPWTPPLGIGILKSFLEQRGYRVKCLDFNTEPELWGMHHKYFGALQTLESVSINDGYSKLWWILNAHMLAYANGAGPAECAKVLKAVTPLYGIVVDEQMVSVLISLVDRFFKRMKALTDEMDFSGYSTVGTSTYTTSLGPSIFLLKNIKRDFPHVKTVMGGGVFADDLALESDNLDTLVREYDFIDHIILGEGELLLLKLLDGELAHKRVISLADLRGKTLEMKDVPIPDFSDTDPGDYYHLSIEGARSCPFQCSFCSETIQWGEYRKKPTDIFTEQVSDLARRYHNNSFFMGDSLMNPYINPFAAKLLETKASIFYDGYLRADKPVTNRKFVKLWADSGCYRVRLGIESAAARVLTSMDKMTTPQVISDVLKTLANEGIRTTTYWIVGFPGETEEDFLETCEFIRRHHRFIYELEAHPYYYYPYGQIGSRLYQCFSLYPEEVTEIIKFKVWDIIDAQPTRIERYDRLRRISKLASELGLPNIYTMAERFDAERRWHALYPPAVEVYEGSRIGRNSTRLPETPLEIFSPEARRSPAAGGPGQVLCYHVSVNRRLDEAALSAAVSRLMESREMLRVRLDSGKYVPVPPAVGAHDEQAVGVYPAGEEAEAAAPSVVEIVEELSATMRPEPKASLRVALVNRKNSAELLLMAHRAVADGRSVVLLLEDLYRLYEQLSNNREISLKPVEKTYTEFINGLEAVDFDDDAGSEGDATRAPAGADGEGPRPGRVDIELDGELSKRIFPEAPVPHDLKPAEIIAAALLGLLARVAGSGPEVDITADYRVADATLNDTVAPLTLVRRLPRELMGDADPRSRALKMRRFLKEITPGEAAARSAHEAGGKVLLNFEYMTEEPWLGGYHYTPRGFIDLRGEPRDPYLLEIAPARSADGVRLELRFGEGARALAVEVAGGFGEQVEAVLWEEASFLAAEQFWVEELGPEAMPPSVGVFGESGDDAGAGWAAVPCDIEGQTVEKMCARLKAEPAVALLGALSVLLSRLNGQESVCILTSVGGGEGHRVVPVRLNPAWSLSFDEFIEQVCRKFRLASEHSRHALKVLNGRLTQRPTPAPSFEVGYVFQDSAADTRPLLEGLRQWHLPSTHGLALGLAVTKKDEALSLHFVYETSRLRREILNKMSSYLQAIVGDAADDGGHALGDIALAEERKDLDLSATLARDVFSFN